MKFGIVKDWMTESGLRAVVYMTEMGHHCGYVGVPENHPAYGMDYSDDALEGIEVHGGLTYSSQNEDYPVTSETPIQWLGYDCGHAWDAPSPEYYDSLNEVTQKYSRSFHDSDCIFRDVEYCMKECESLGKQLLACIRITKWSES